MPLVIPNVYIYMKNVILQNNIRKTDITKYKMTICDITKYKMTICDITKYMASALNQTRKKKGKEFYDRMNGVVRSAVIF